MRERSTIYINGRFLTQRVTGVQRYCREILVALDEVIRERSDLKIMKWVLVVPPNTTAPGLSSIEVETLPGWKGNLWEQLSLYWRTRKATLVNFATTGPLLHQNQLITVHDASIYRVPDAFNWKFKLWYRVMVNWIVRRSKTNFAVSEFAKSECIKFYGVRKENICVTSEGWQHFDRIQPVSDSEIGTLVGNKPFVLAVSSLTPNKNFAIVAKAIEKIGNAPFQFVVAGTVDPAVFGGKHKQAPNATYLGYVSDEQLKGLYRNALCFVFPSRYEGFGIPPLEAMAMGCPVVASNIAAVTEVCGDAVTYFDPANADQLAEKLVAITSTVDAKTYWGRKGLERCQQFSWRSAATRIADHLIQNYS